MHAVNNSFIALYSEFDENHGTFQEIKRYCAARTLRRTGSVESVGCPVTFSQPSLGLESLSPFAIKEDGW